MIAIRKAMPRSTIALAIFCCVTCYQPSAAEQRPLKAGLMIVADSQVAAPSSKSNSLQLRVTGIQKILDNGGLQSSQLVRDAFRVDFSSPTTVVTDYNDYSGFRENTADGLIYRVYKAEEMLTNMSADTNRRHVVSADLTIFFLPSDCLLVSSVSTWLPPGKVVADTGFSAQVDYYIFPTKPGFYRNQIEVRAETLPGSSCVHKLTLLDSSNEGKH